MKFKKQTNDHTRELIEQLQEQDVNIKTENAIKNEKAKEVEDHLTLVQMQYEAQVAKERALEEERKALLLQKYASEVTIYKSEMDKASAAMEEIDKQLIDLIEKTQKRADQLSTQFIDLNKERVMLYTQNEIESKNELSDDIRTLQRKYSSTLERNQRILDKEAAKEQATQRNIDVLSKTIGITLVEDSKSKK